MNVLILIRITQLQTNKIEDIKGNRESADHNIYLIVQKKKL